MLEQKLVDENKTKWAAFILNKIFISNSVSISEETNVMHINDEPQGVDVTSFLYSLQQPTKLTCLSIPKSCVNLIYQLTWFIILTQKKVEDQFYSEDEKETASRQPKQKNEKEQEGRRSEPKEKTQSQVSMKVKRRQRKRRVEKTGISIDDVRKLNKLYLNGHASFGG